MLLTIKKILAGQARRVKVATCPRLNLFATSSFERNQIMDDRPGDKTELIARIERGWTSLLQLVEGVRPEKLDVPDQGGWSIKDNLAHLTAWEHFLNLHYLQDQPAHEAMQVDAKTFEQASEDDLNAIFQKRNHGRSVAAVIDDFRRSHQQLLATLERMSFAELLQPRYADDPERRPLIDWVIGNTYDHYEEHQQNIQKVIDAQEAAV
jgi:hypothetical protein